MFEHFLSECLSADQIEQKRKPLPRNKSSYCIRYPYIYFFGGRRNNICLKDFWRFNIEKQKWEEIFVDEIPLFEDHATCFFDDKLYVFGGQFGVYQSNFLSWSEGNKRFKSVKHHGLPPPNYRGHTVCAHGLCVYVFGGWNEQLGASNTLWKYNTSLKTWTSMKPFGDGPCRRYDHSLVVFNDSMWIFGGTNQLHKRCSDFWRYNFNLNCWNQVKSNSSPPSLCCHSAAVCKNFMLICGGKTFEDRPNSDLWSFSFKTQLWKRLGTIEQHIGCNLIIYDVLSMKVIVHRGSADVGNVQKIDSNFVRCINGNQAQKSGDSGYSETKTSSSQESLISDKVRKLAFPKKSMTNLGFINDDFKAIPGYVRGDSLEQRFTRDDSLEQRKYASTLAIPTINEHSNHNNDVELVEFPSSTNKTHVVKESSGGTIVEENVNKILFIGHILGSKTDISMYTLCSK